MWLLDHNVPSQILSELKARGISCATAKDRQWDRLRNGELAEAAVTSGFTCILTRDALFEESATKVLKKYPQLGLVLITLPQVPAKQFVESFKKAIAHQAIQPVPGSLVLWP